MKWFQRIAAPQPAGALMRPDSTDGSSPECVIAIARALLATSTVLIVSFETTEPRVYAAAAQGLIAAYAVFAGLMLPLTCGRFAGMRPSGVVFVACDLSFAFLIALLTRGPASPFFPFLLFALISAAYRWGPHETLVTTAVAAGALTMEGVLVGGSGPLSIGLLAGDFEWPRAVVYVAYLSVAGLILAIVAEKEEQRRREAAVIASITTQARRADSPDATFEAIIAGVLRAWSAGRAVLVLKEIATDRVYRWDATAATGADGGSAGPFEVDADQRSSYLFEVPGPSWHALRVRPGSDWFELVALDRAGRRLPTVVFSFPPSFLAVYNCEGVLGTSVSFGDEWSGRLFLIDPAIKANREAALRLADLIAHRIAPAAHQAYLLGTLRARAVTAERARLARELHDGVVQSLVAAEIEIDILRRQAAASAPQIIYALTRVQTMLRREARTMRELTSRLKFRNAAAAPVPDLGDVVARFARETGIEARYFSDPTAAGMTRRASHEVSRILQEGLVNVRKHSGARHVLVRAAAANGLLRLSIEDDGRGFPFSGRLTKAEMEATRQGPAVIMERARALGGDVVVESTPGRGARVEVAVRLEA